MVKLNNHKKQDLTLKDLEKFTVWTFDDSNEYIVPVEKPEKALQKHYPLFIKSRFITNGYVFDGYLIGGKSFYGFGIFVNENELVFNLNAAEHAKDVLEKLFELLNCKPFKFFPVHYESDVVIKGIGEISGILNCAQ